MYFRSGKKAKAKLSRPVTYGEERSAKDIVNDIRKDVYYIYFDGRNVVT